MQNFKILNGKVANQFLCEFNLRIGRWEQIEAQPNTRSDGVLIVEPPRDSVDQHYLIKEIAAWILAPGWLILKLDNSTFPLESEMDLFNFTASGGAHEVNLHQDRSFLIEESEVREGQVILILYLVINFRWHVQFVCQGNANSRWLSVLDGYIYFRGNPADIDFAKKINVRWR